MIRIKIFTFNPFQENTYIISDTTGSCIIIDPGCYDREEKEELAGYIQQENLRPEFILLTHTHIDHILGNNFVSAKYHIPIQMCELETGLLHAAPEYGQMWGIGVEPSPEPELFVSEKKEIHFGTTVLKPLFTPGHSPGSFSYLHENSGSLFSGDVLFMESIGRTDLPGGDFETLIRSIREKLFSLPANTKVYPGHGPSTTVGYEIKHNPFLAD